MSVLKSFEQVSEERAQKKKDFRTKRYHELFNEWLELEKTLRKDSTMYKTIGSLSLNEHETLASRAKTLMQTLSPQDFPDDLTTIYDILPNMHPELAGYFLSAAFNCSPQTEFLLPASTPFLKGVGYELSKYKLLRNFAKLEDLGEYSKGMIENYGEVKEFARKGSGIYINTGTVESFCDSGYYSISINRGEAVTYVCHLGIQINEGTAKDFGYTDVGLSINLGKISERGSLAFDLAEGSISLESGGPKPIHEYAQKYPHQHAIIFEESKTILNPFIQISYYNTAKEIYDYLFRTFQTTEGKIICHEADRIMKRYAGIEPTK